MKDPAFLFYPNDWSGGTIAMSRHVKGAYIDIIVAQFNLGPLSLDEIKTVLGSDFGLTWPALQKKFVKGENDLYYNQRLLTEQTKRSKFSESRRNNAKHMLGHMENENRDSIKYLEELPEKDIEEFYKIYETSRQAIKDKAKALVLWCETNGKQKKNYRSFLLVALNKDFQKRKEPLKITKVEIINGKPTLVL